MIIIAFIEYIQHKVGYFAHDLVSSKIRHKCKKQQAEFSAHHNNKCLLTSSLGVLCVSKKCFLYYQRIDRVYIYLNREKNKQIRISLLNAHQNW